MTSRQEALRRTFSGPSVRRSLLVALVIGTVLNAINRGEIYRFYTKPWDDQALRDNIREAFRYHATLHGGDHATTGT